MNSTPVTSPSPPTPGASPLASPGNVCSAVRQAGAFDPARSLAEATAATGNPSQDQRPVHCRLLTSTEAFAAARESWEACPADPMNSFAWNFSWWSAHVHHHALKGNLHLVQFEKAGAPIGFAPLFWDRWYGLKRLRFLASGDACTDYVDLICSPSDYESCLKALVQHLQQQAFDMIELDATQDNRLADVLQHTLTRYRHEARTTESVWRLEVPGSWDEFRSNSKSSLRRKLNKSEKRIASGEFQIATTANDLAFDGAFEQLKQLHALRWLSKGHKGVFNSPSFTEFLETATRELSQEERCEIVTVTHKGQTIGAQLYLTAAAGFQFYQSGYCPNAMKLEPGYLMFVFMIQRAIERGDTLFDFLRGDEPYKSYWGAKPQPQSKLRLFAKRLLPTTVSAAIQIARRLTPHRGPQE